MKGFRIAALTGALSLLGTAPALAASNVDMPKHQTSYDRQRTAEEWQKLRDNSIEWDEIQDLVHEYNPTVSKLWITFREDEKDGVYSIDYEEALEAVEESYSDAVAAAETDVAQALADLSYISSTARTSIDNTAQSSDREAAIYGIEQTEKTMAESLKKSIITIYSTEEQNKLNALTVQHNQASYDTAVRKQAVGSATALEVLTAKETLEQSSLTATSSETNLAKLKQLLYVSLGWNYDGNPTLCAVPMPTEEQMDSLNLETDTALALQNNYAILINERKMAVSEVDSNVNSLAVNIENQKQMLKSDMIARYRALSEARGNLTQARLTLQNAQSTFEKVQRSYSVGGASLRDLETAQYGLDSADIALKIAEYTVAAEYYDYIAGRDGLATTSAG